MVSFSSFSSLGSFPQSAVELAWSSTFTSFGGELASSSSSSSSVVSEESQNLQLNWLGPQHLLHLVVNKHRLPPPHLLWSQRNHLKVLEILEWTSGYSML